MTSTRASTAALACATLAIALAALAPAPASAQMFGRLRNRGSGGEFDDGTAADTRVTQAPAGTRVVRDVAYGADAAQRFDVYLPATPTPGAAPAPVVFFVHGGGWQRGDKAISRVVEPKVAHWVQQGWVVISTDYRMLPTPVATQAQDVAAAIAFAQAHAGDWNADPARFVLMGHSAGAHLVALLAAGAKTAASPRPWRGAVLLDSAVFDVPLVMTHRHLPLYDRAFGADPQQWPAVSPYGVLVAGTAPFLEVCSTRRRQSCQQAERFAAKVQSLGGQARVLREDLSHGEINATLGAPSDYTSQVDAFLQSLR